MDTIVGIDLGTTNSLCSVFLDEAPRLVPNAHGEFLTPSVVGRLADGRVVVGDAARELQVTHPDQAVACFKRWMGTDRSFEIGGRQFSPTELSSLVLRSLKSDAEQFLNSSVRSAVITVPAYFNENQRKATKQAGELAGLKVRRIVNEPTAAALTYGFHDRDSEKNIIVIDLGGGTFDVTVMEIFDGTLEIISTAGESMLGGEDFTDRLVASILQREGIQFEQAELLQPLRTSRLRQECEMAKRQLLEQERVQIRVPDEQGLFPGEERSDKVTLDRPGFAKLTKPLLERLRRPINQAIRDGELQLEQISQVILVGGATRMPVMREFVRDYLKCEPLIEFNPDEVVALGASIQAALIDDDAAVDDMVMTDVCPFTLGVEVVKEFGGRVVPGFYSPVIHRNTTIPVSREESYATMAANQTEVLLKIYQGEARKVDNNLLLGELKVDGIPPGPAGQEFLVRFTYDLNGLLEIEAVLPATGRKYSTVLANHAVSLDEAELQAAVEALQQLKFYPRDDLQHQRLLLFAERMVGEVSPFQRNQLEEVVDSFERAMSSGDRDLFSSAREQLLTTLSQLGVPYEGQGEPE